MSFTLFGELLRQCAIAILVGFSRLFLGGDFDQFMDES